MLYLLCSWACEFFRHSNFSSHCKDKQEGKLKKKQNKTKLLCILYCDPKTTLHWSLSVSQPDSKRMAYIEDILNVATEIKDPKPKYFSDLRTPNPYKNQIVLNPYDWFTIIINFVRVVI